MEGERRLDKLEAHASTAESRLENIELRQAEQGRMLQSQGSKLDHQGATLTQHGDILHAQSSKLDQLIMAVTRAEAAPKFDWLRTLQAVALVVGMMMGVTVPAAGFGVWFVTTLTAKDNEVQNVRINYAQREREQDLARLAALEKTVTSLYARAGWKPEVEKQ